MNFLNIITRDFKQYGPIGRWGPRLRHPGFPKVLANSIPKSGTNLLMRALYLSPSLRRKLRSTLYTCSIEAFSKQLRQLGGGQVLPAHLHHDIAYQMILDSCGVKKLLMVRDPRDIALSNLHYITYQDNQHYLHDYLANGFTTDSERLLALIEGRSHRSIFVPSLAYVLGKYVGWLEDPQTLLIKYEDLVGESGGGSAQIQQRTLGRIYDHIGISATQVELREICLQLYSSSSRTFHKGKIYRWKTDYHPNHLAAVKNTCSDLLIRLGYETDTNWGQC